ncbi:thioesterase II family protein [Desulfobulbus elongatus]|uniref:thioesterase II family protein n=1 Tax=Desulfobulbus elongatus TaxID=53332 RepID=UPI00048622E3|nr:alpha/beta fold hydrolase [Desulfobulbus elongatus]
MRMNDYNGTSWIFPPSPGADPDFRLFCFPYAGGGASIFRQWQEKMPPGVQVCGVQLPGRENRITEAPCTDLLLLVERIFAGLRPLMDRPFAFFGHSLGAKLAFELARLLRKRSQPQPRHLFIAGSRAPHLREPRPLHHLPEHLFIEELRRYAATPDVLLENRELMAFYLPLLRADFTVDETYVHSAGTPLQCPLTVYGGLDDREVAPGELEAWQQHSTGAFCCRMFAGNHFFIKSAQDLVLEELHRDISGLLRRSETCR